jgi:hypothetical protein
MICKLTVEGPRLPTHGLNIRHFRTPIVMVIASYIDSGVSVMLCTNVYYLLTLLQLFLVFHALPSRYVVVKQLF